MPSASLEQCAGVERAKEYSLNSRVWQWSEISVGWKWLWEV